MKKKNERKRNAVDVSSDDHINALGVFRSMVVVGF
jgi:hypothetical protein